MYIPLVDSKFQYQSIKAEILEMTKNIIEFKNRIAVYCNTKHAVGINFGNLVISTPYILVIEDTAQSIGVKYKEYKAGSFDICSCFSLFLLKILGVFEDESTVIINFEKFNKILNSMKNHG